MTMATGSGDVAADRIDVRPARPDDLPAVLALIEASGLPVAGVEEWLPRFLVAERAGVLVATAGLEVHGPDGLLRSVAVAADWRGRGLGTALTDRLIAEAVRLGLHSVYLLTTTAEGYFPRHGFRRIGREEVIGPVANSVEFREACPATAAAMVLVLGAPASSS